MDLKRGEGWVRRQAKALVLAVLLACFGQATCAVFYLSPSGSDDNLGSEGQPFGTIERAAREVRKLRAASPGEAITVNLRGGRYELNQPWVIQPQDSGTPEAPVVWQGARGETPLISGGKLIRGWQKRDRLWVAHVPWGRPDGALFYQLFVKGQRRVRARTPNEGEYFYTRSLRLTRATIPAAYGMSYSEMDIRPEMRTDDVAIVLFHNWLNSFNRIDMLDPESRRVRFLQLAGVFFPGPQTRYYVENTLVALDSPGEWYFDKAKSELYYFPMPNEDLVSAEVIAPFLPSPMIRFDGDPKAGHAVEHLTFRRLHFQHADADLSMSYRRSGQGAMEQRGALTAVGLRHSVFEECDFSQLGEHGISLLAGCTSNLIRQCHFQDLGGGGVYLSGDGNIGNDERLLTSHNLVENNFIHDGGLIFRGACGVFLGGSATHNRILHNEICDFSWTGIHLGWSWTGLKPSNTHHNEVAWNHIHHLGNGVLSDLAGIYTLGVSPGTTVHHNLIHDITRFERVTEGYGGWGIYLDAGSSEIQVEYNVVHDTRDGGLHLHCDAFPHGNVVANNIFAYSSAAQVVRNNDKEPEGIHVIFERNIVMNRHPILMRGNWGPSARVQVDRNCYWSEETRSPKFMEGDLSGWQKAGRDSNGLVADPRFQDARRRDFRLRSGSPAFAMGIESVDLRAVGLTGSSAWRSLPTQAQHRKLELAKGVPDLGFSEDFEDYEPGMEPVGAAARDHGTSALISTNGPHSGRQCLQLVDSSDGASWKPHWSVMKELGNGQIRFSCWIKGDAEHPVRFELEGRDWRSFKAGDRYWTGPLLSFRDDGLVQVGSLSGWTTIGKYPLGVWTRVDLDLSPGGTGSKGFGIRVSTDKGEQFSQRGLGYVHKALGSCNWFGVSGMESKEGKFQLDDVRLEPVSVR